MEKGEPAPHPKFCDEGVETNIESDDIGLSVADAIHAYAALDAIAKGETTDHLREDARSVADRLERQLLTKISDEQEGH